MLTSIPLRIVALGALAFAMFPLAASAFVVDPTALVGQAGKVVIGEGPDSTNSLYIDYLVDVLDPSTQVAAFAVSGGSAGSSIVTFPGWTASALTASLWDSGFTFSIGGATSVNTNSLGTASSFFGNDSHISLFWLDTGTNVIFDDGISRNDQNQDEWETAPIYFYSNTARRSELVALDINGLMIDSSYSIPEPATLLLFGAACCACLAGRRGRHP